ncbi:early endosome antigen 1-like [Monomorium pharaonis]|uniref:early endosome antigen 1-like n=1 Tax=Monomorium pharaonis TaxID=307658 RepID=UPI0017476BA2|nr:early endosome antigen 1-like [Monomorium pharaonis]
MNRQLKEQEELVCNKLSKFKSDLLPINVTLKDKENLDLSNITDTPPSPKKYRVTEDLAQTKNKFMQDDNLVKALTKETNTRNEKEKCGNESPKKQLKHSKTFQMNCQLKEQEELVCNKLSNFKSDLLPMNAVTLKDKENLDLSNITDTPPSPKKYRVTEDLAQTKNKFMQDDNLVKALTEETNTRNEKEKCDNESQKLSRSKVIPKITCISKVHSLTECKEAFEKLIKENSKLRTEGDELINENKKLKSSRKELKKQIEEKESEIKKLRELNDGLQISFIQKTKESTKEYESKLEQLSNSRERLDYSQNYPAIGILRTSDDFRRVHIGRNQWGH